jgi:hypothetical protein
MEPSTNINNLITSSSMQPRVEVAVQEKIIAEKFKQVKRSTEIINSKEVEDSEDDAVATKNTKERGDSVEEESHCSNAMVTVEEALDQGTKTPSDGKESSSSTMHPPLRTVEAPTKEAKLSTQGQDEKLSRKKVKKAESKMEEKSAQRQGEAFGEERHAAGRTSSSKKRKPRDLLAKAPAEDKATRVQDGASKPTHATIHHDVDISPPENVQILNEELICVQSDMRNPCENLTLSTSLQLTETVSEKYNNATDQVVQQDNTEEIPIPLEMADFLTSDVLQTALVLCGIEGSLAHGSLFEDGVNDVEPECLLGLGGLGVQGSEDVADRGAASLGEQSERDTRHSESAKNDQIREEVCQQATPAAIQKEAKRKVVIARYEPVNTLRKNVSSCPPKESTKIAASKDDQVEHRKQDESRPEKQPKVMLSGSEHGKEGVYTRDEQDKRRNKQQKDDDDRERKKSNNEKQKKDQDNESRSSRDETKGHKRKKDDKENGSKNSDDEGQQRGSSKERRQSELGLSKKRTASPKGQSSPKRMLKSVVKVRDARSPSRSSNKRTPAVSHRISSPTTRRPSESSQYGLLRNYRIPKLASSWSRTPRGRPWGRLGANSTFRRSDQRSTAPERQYHATPCRSETPIPSHQLVDRRASRYTSLNTTNRQPRSSTRRSSIDRNDVTAKESSTERQGSRHTERRRENAGERQDPHSIRQEIERLTKLLKSQTASQE